MALVLVGYRYASVRLLCLFLFFTFRPACDFVRYLHNSPYYNRINSKMDNEHASAIHSWSPTSNVINLSASHQEGLVAVGSFAALSIVTTSLLLLFLIRRALLHTVVHAKQASSFKHDILILNLLLAQLIQSLGFVVGIRWSVAGHISASSGWCDAQAGFLQTGDLASGAFALAIAVQCFWMTVRRRKMSHVCMLLIGLVIWVFAIILTASGRASKVDFFAPGAGDWCEISQKYGAERLWLHYFWLFLDAVCYELA